VHNEQDMLKIFDEDNAYLSSWPTEQKIDWIQRWEEDIG
jgi:hypothetical protein